MAEINRSEGSTVSPFCSIFATRKCVSPHNSQEADPFRRLRGAAGRRTSAAATCRRVCACAKQPLGLFASSSVSVRRTAPCPVDSGSRRVLCFGHTERSLRKTDSGTPAHTPRGAMGKGGTMVGTMANAQPSASAEVLCACAILAAPCCARAPWRTAGFARLGARARPP